MMDVNIVSMVKHDRKLYIATQHEIYEYSNEKMKLIGKVKDGELVGGEE